MRQRGVSMIALRCVILLAVASVCTVSPARAVQARQDYRSPDGMLIATINDLIKAHENRVEMRRSKGKLLLVQDYSSPDMEHGQSILKAAWTPDGKFFVFSMKNTGGHSPMGRPTSFYSRRENRIYNLALKIGYITEWNFKLESPNWIMTQCDGRPVRVALSALVK